MTSSVTPVSPFRGKVLFARLCGESIKAGLPHGEDTRQTRPRILVSAREVGHREKRPYVHVRAVFGHENLLV